MSSDFTFSFPDGVPASLSLYITINPADTSGVDNTAVLAAIADVRHAVLSLETQTKLQGAQVAVDLSALRASVENADTVQDSAIALIQGISTQLAELIANAQDSVDPAELQALVDQLNSGSTELGEAVVANTPAVNTPPVDPTPVDPAPVDPAPVDPTQDPNVPVDPDAPPV